MGIKNIFFGDDTIFIKDETFRNLFANFIVIKDAELSIRQAKMFHIDSIIGDDENLEGEELFERINNYELEEEVNSMILLPYVDHTAGLSFQMVATCLLKNDKLTVYEREDDFQILSNYRFDSLKDVEFEYLDNLDLNPDFDIESYKDHAMEIFYLYNDNDKLFTLRKLDILDELREPEYPDDVFVGFFKKGFGGEGMWVRYEDFEETDFYGILLNQPEQNLGVNKGDRVKFHITKNKNDKIFCFCDLDE